MYGKAWMWNSNLMAEFGFLISSAYHLSHRAYPVKNQEEKMRKVMKRKTFLVSGIIFIS